MKIRIPNILTIGRIIIVPIFVISFFLPGFFGDLIPFFLFVLAVFNPVRKILSKTLDEQIKLIKEKIEEAENLKNEAKDT